MKSHIRTIVTPKILFYGIEPGSPKGQELAELCRAQNILWEEVPSHRLGDPLGKRWCFADWKKKRSGSC